jgi:hypothetical protein
MIVYSVSIITVENVYSLFSYAVIQTVVIIRTFVCLIQNAVFYGVPVLFGSGRDHLQKLSVPNTLSYWDTG